MKRLLSKPDLRHNIEINARYGATIEVEFATGNTVTGIFCWTLPNGFLLKTNYGDREISYDNHIVSITMR